MQSRVSRELTAGSCPSVTCYKGSTCEQSANQIKKNFKQHFAFTEGPMQKFRQFREKVKQPEI